MRCSWRHGAVAAVLAAALAAACSEPFAPVTITAPDSIVVQARSLHSALLEWFPIDNPNVIAYRIERRTEFSGDFEVIKDNVPQTLPGPLFVLDDSLNAETFYGYRIRVLDRYGGVSEASVVRGVKTPPVPGIVIGTVSRLEASTAADADGYTVLISSGSDSIVGPLSPSGERRFGPLPPGDYTVRLRGLAPNCVVDNGAMMRDAPVTDIGLNTLTRVDYVLTCADPNLGRITARVDVSGEDRDSNGVTLHLVGAHPSAPESLRVTRDSAQLIGPNGGQKSWQRLRPGDFEISLVGLASKCTPDALTRSVTVKPLSDDTVTFAVTCPTPAPDTTTQPGYQLSNTFGAVANNKVTLTVAIDMGAFNDQAVNGAGPDDIAAIQGSTRYDTTRLRFVSADKVTGSGLTNPVVNGSTPGTVSWLNISTSAAQQTGVQGVIAITFDVLASGSVQTHTLVDAAVSQDETDLLSHIVVREGVLAGGSTRTNEPPVAHANGPYSGIAGAAVTLSASGSTDPDGTIAGYLWSFGDGGSGTGAASQHTYATAGTYTATLTVTDNQAATGQATAQVTISSSGGNQPPVAHANGPYNGTVGSAVTFSASGTSDPDGTIASYQWTFGDGGSGTGTAPQHTYASPGTYTATLLVTDNLGATSQSTAQVTITQVSGATPFTWRYTFTGTPQKDSIVALNVELDLTTDIAQTPGAEELLTFVVDSLKWNPAVLQYFSFNYGPGGSGSVQNNAPQGKLAIQGTLGSANQAGLIQVAVIRFKVIGNPAQSMSTATALGALTGTAATGGFAYRPLTRIQEATLTVQ